jgi:hypothetical protein
MYANRPEQHNNTAIFQEISPHSRNDDFEEATTKHNNQQQSATTERSELTGSIKRQT